MSLADKIRNTDTEKTQPGPKPKMVRLLAALSDSDRSALEALLVNQGVTNPKVGEILSEESADLSERAEREDDEDEKARLEELADLHDISAFTIGRFRRQVRAGRPGVY